MENFKDRLITSFPVFSQWLKQKMFRVDLVAGAIAGPVAVAGVKYGDELVSVINVTDETDLTSEFTITKDGVIDNTGGTTSAAKNLIVTYIQWKLR